MTENTTEWVLPFASLQLCEGELIPDAGLVIFDYGVELLAPSVIDVGSALE